MTRRALRFALATSLGQASAALVTIPLSILASELGADGGEGVATALAVVMVVVGVLEGVITGAAQSFVLRDRVEPSRYIARTAGGFGLGWTVGAASSFVEAEGLSRPLFVLGMALVQGLLLGAIVGMLVATELAPDRPSRVRVVAGLAVGWGAGLVVAALSTALASSSQALVEVGLGVLRGGVVGLVAGAIAGPFVASALDPSEG